MPKSRTCYKKLRSQVQCPLAFRFCFAEKIPFFGFNKKLPELYLSSGSGIRLRAM